ncbi:hypothetical protein V1L52_12115 [Treponema sp. HNW]|uniref:aldose epimerase family protein n=1 Tax=Treponema sp. HNW TaxID=3116654 RepID=UPI003D130B8C
MKKTLCNDYLEITIDSLGAELTAIKLRSGIDVLWPGKEGVWNSHAPLLFPWSGRIKNGLFTHKGKTFEGNIHGFIGHTEHRCTAESADTLSFEASSSSDTLKLFPYDFCLVQTFKLENTKLTHTVEVTNTGAEPMFFGLGFHPGFICPFAQEKTVAGKVKNAAGKVKDAARYELVFDTPERPDLIDITKNGLPSGIKTPLFYRETRGIALTDDLFKGETVCLAGLKGSSITLRERPPRQSNDGFQNGGETHSLPKSSSAVLQAVEVGIEDIPYLLLWSAATEKLEFICIEPWYSLPDFESAESEWETKQNLLRLEAGNTFTARLALTFHIA